MLVWMVDRDKFAVCTINRYETTCDNYPPPYDFVISALHFGGGERCPIRFSALPSRAHVTKVHKWVGGGKGEGVRVIGYRLRKA